MQRRSFITLLGSAAAAWPVVARAQQSKMPTVGWLSGSFPAHLGAAFRQGLRTTGYVENQNLLIEHRSTFEYDQLPAMAADLVRRQVAIIFASGSAASGLAAKGATTTIPIVFACVEDPVKSGLVDSLNRPGGNVTGASFFASPLEEKRMELLRELLPAAKRIGVLVNATFSGAQMQIRDLQVVARTFGQQITVASASNDLGIKAAFSSFVEQHADAILVASDPFLFSRRDQLAVMAARIRVPTIYNVRQYVEAGGLLSYGTNVAESYYLAGTYVGRILKGEKPGDLPVQLPTKFELVINLKTSKALGLTIPPMLLARADEVIE